MKQTLVIVWLLAAALAKPAAAASAATAPAPAATTPAAAAAIDVNSPEPPTALLPAANNDVLQRYDSERTMLGQIARTLLALLFVLGLIFVLAKVLLPRLTRASAVLGRGGKMLRVVERAQLDARHAVYLVEVAGGHRLVVGTNDRGVHLVAQLAPAAEAPAETVQPRSFAAALQQDPIPGAADGRMQSPTHHEEGHEGHA